MRKILMLKVEPQETETAESAQSTMKLHPRQNNQIKEGGSSLWVSYHRLGSPGSANPCSAVFWPKPDPGQAESIIINADMNVPMLPVWLPEQIIQTNTSIGQVLSSVEIDTSLVASHVTVLRNTPS